LNTILYCGAVHNLLEYSVPHYSLYQLVYSSIANTLSKSECRNSVPKSLSSIAFVLKLISYSNHDRGYKFCNESHVWYYCRLCFM